MLKRVVIVTNSGQPPIANSMARAFSHFGGKPNCLSTTCNSLFDKFIIHPINAHTQRGNTVGNESGRTVKGEFAAEKF